MSAEARPRARELFLASCERPPEERSDFLRLACRGDKELYREVQSLLAYKDDEEVTVVSPTSASPPRTERFLPGTVLGGRYRVVALVGRGGMGEVYQADDLRLGVSVALKFLPEWQETEDDMRRRFLEEVKLARAITHPNVCRVYDVGEADGHPFISMEYIDGEDLASLLDRGGPLPPAEAVEILHQVLAGLDAAHRQGIVHRDLKPSNLMIDARGQARITDFGLAVLAAGPLSDAEVMTGTPAYMAPEQLAGWEVTVQSDLYALGLVFYELISGRPAFPTARSISEMLRLRQETAPDPPSDLVEDLDPGIEAVILRLLEKHPHNRPAAAREVAAALPGGDSPPILMTLVTSDLTRISEGHGERLRALVEEHGGQEIGDDAESTLTRPVLFERPWNAVCWALAYHRALSDGARSDGARSDGARSDGARSDDARSDGAGEPSGEGNGAARVGIHLTEVSRLPGGEPTVDAAALDLVRRLTSLGRGRQTLLTRGAFDLARQASDGSPSWLAHGAYRLAGSEEPVEVFEVGQEGFAPLTPPAGSRQAQRVTQEDAILGWRPAAGQTIEARPRWRLLRRLGEGGYGEVWLAEHDQTGERRAFKFCFEAKRLRALKREITLFRLLKEGLGERDDIARILDWNFETVPYFIESEHTGGGDLAEWTDRQGGLSEIPQTTRLAIVAQVAEALSAAHSVGVLHKDVKPGNVLIHTDSEGRPQARLADFGIGLATDESRLQQPGVTVLGMTTRTLEGDDGSGTPLYRAPELLEGKTPTLQADIYALGVMLYQMVVGDFHQALGPGWERDVDDEILREDISAVVDKSPRRRLGNAMRLAERLDALAERREQREAERRERQAAERARQELKLTRRRRKVVALAMVALAIFAGAMMWQANRVARERDRANKEAKTAREVADFMVRIFEVSDPGSARGKKITAREILELGAVRIESELRDQPEVQARMMRTIGVVYRSLGLYEEAAPLLETALSIRRRLWGEEHIEVAESLDDLAVLARFQGEYERAEAMGREALEMRRLLHGDEHLDIATSLNTVAGVLSDRGEHDTAENLYREALAMRQRLLGDEHPDLAENLNSIAAMLEKKGDYEAAESLYREALAMRRRLLGDQHPALARSLNNVAAVLKARGDYEAAEEFYREALAMRRRLLDDEHPDIATSLNNLAQVLQAQGHLEAAEQHYREALAIRQNALGEEHPDLATSLISLGYLLWEKGDLEAAEPFYREALAIRRQVLGNHHPRTASSLNHLASVVMAKGEVAEAETLYKEALGIQRRRWGDEHPEVAYGLESLAWVLEVKGDAEAAEPLYREALAIRLRHLGREHPEVARSLNQVTRVLLERGEFQDAEKLIREALEILQRVLPEDHWQIAEARVALGAALTGLGRLQEAESLLFANYAVLKEQRGETAGVTERARRYIALFHEARGIEQHGNE